jgi:hypothetical protein
MHERAAHAWGAAKQGTALVAHAWGDSDKRSAAHASRRQENQSRAFSARPSRFHKAVVVAALFIV